MSTEKRIEKLEAMVRELKQRTSNLPARWGKGNTASAVDGKMVVLDELCAAGGGAHSTVYEWDETWSSTGEDLIVRDFRTPGGDDISSGTRCVVIRMHGTWWIVAAECP